MFTLVIGGAASGKSEFAEELLLAGPVRPRYYVATMQPFGPEARARIAKHRAMRAGKGFETMERPRDLAGLSLPGQGAVLVEDLGNLAANELFGPEGRTAPEAALTCIRRGIDALLAQSAELVVVSNEIFTGGSRYDGDTDTYLRLLGAAHRILARQADCVCEVVCGLPRYWKGGSV